MENQIFSASPLQFPGQPPQASGSPVTLPSSPLFFPVRLILTILLTTGLFACSSPGDKVQPKDKPTEQASDSKLTVFGGSFDAIDESGKLLWRVDAKQAKYIKEKEIGQAENPYGELFQDGKVVYKVTADKADIEQNDKKLVLILRGQIVATDPVNGVVLRGNELEWRPKEDLLIVRNKLTGKHKQLDAVAQEARVKTREQRVDFFGGVVANSLEPPFQVRTEHLIWQVKQEKLIGDRPLQFFRSKNNQITDRGKGDAANIDLKTKIVTITKNAQIELADPRMQIVSNSMAWNLNTEIVTTKTPIRVLHLTENILVTANQGELRIPQNTVYLQGKVNAIGKRRQAIRSDKLTWYLNNQQVEAQGNVVYQQAEPSLTFTGESATGNIQQEKIVVKSGGSGQRVITNIVPSEPKSE
ncbi:LPS export ABC transporter periplasmic protein LptC [Calothrix sp. UHCC 0171]|uniref:LPS export ABC transporter periplasmic protein LptC n=1 Tax=Calothrix sp. UHCC 0171 TaxID=3110245 RepID=UPI002B1EB1EE|nr:LPS export ABC transporter periplasmic protein LptC [Calothrix sp. UHCC 0171]MEA5572425.1 LPS export ABC transporter periplasmic protein LptC [Calothrix sp. UHCC 0171]